MSTTAEHIQEDENDSWLTLIDQFWQANPYSKLVPLQPAEMIRALQQIWLDAVKNPDRARAMYSDFVQQYAQVMTAPGLTFQGRGKPAEPVITAEKGDKRFSAPDWEQNPIFDALKQIYLLTATTLLKSASEVEGLDEQQQHKLVFYLRQFLDAISPTNALFTNPQVLHEIVQSGGQNLVSGMEHLLRDLNAGQMKMTDTDAFAPGRNLALTSGQVIYRNRLIELIQYTPTSEKVYEIPPAVYPTVDKQVLHSGHAAAEQPHQVPGGERLHRLRDQLEESRCLNGRDQLRGLSDPRTALRARHHERDHWLAESQRSWLLHRRHAALDDPALSRGERG